MNLTLRRFGKVVLFCLLSLWTFAPSYASKPGDRIDNFKLTDEAGKTHELYEFKNRHAVVLMTQGNGCPIVRLAVPALRRIRDQYVDRGVEFFLLNSNLQDTAAAVKTESQEYEFGLPIWLDHTQKVGETLGVNRTAEVFVIDPKTWKLAYHGPIDDSLSYEKQHPARHQYLADALDAVLSGNAVPVTEVISPGCLINFPNRRQTR